MEDMLSVKPTLSVSGFYTKTSYDFQKKTFSGYSEEKDIIPAGEWEIKDGRLIGKEFILIPQEATPGYQYITLEAAGRLYTSPLPSTLQLKSGMLVCWMDGIRKKLYLNHASTGSAYTDTDNRFKQVIV